MPLTALGETALFRVEAFLEGEFKVALGVGILVRELVPGILTTVCVPGLVGTLLFEVDEVKELSLLVNPLAGLDLVSAEGFFGLVGMADFVVVLKGIAGLVFSFVAGFSVEVLPRLEKEGIGGFVEGVLDFGTSLTTVSVLGRVPDFIGSL